MVGNILGGCLFESVLGIWCSFLLEDAKYRIYLLLGVIIFILIDYIYIYICVCHNTW